MANGSGTDRELLVAAVAKVAAERGYADLTVERVARYAGLPPATFEAHFKSTDQGLLAAQDAFIERLWLDVVGACEGPGEWAEKVRGAVAAVLAALAEASSLARVFAVEGTAASLALVERQHAAFDRFAALLREGRRHYPAAAEFPDAIELALVGGVASVVSRCLLAEEPEALDELEPQLAEFVLTPYLGSAEAHRFVSG